MSFTRSLAMGVSIGKWKTDDSAIFAQVSRQASMQQMAWQNREINISG